MNKTLLPPIFVLLALLLTAAAGHAAVQPLTVAIFDFESKDEPIRDLGPKISALINAQLSADAHVILVERAELEKILGEQELGLAGTVNSDSAAKVGHLTGARVLVTGRAFKIDKDLCVVAKIIGTETGRVYGEMVKAGAGAFAADLATELANKISANLSTNGDTLVASVETRAERVAKIKQQLKPGPLPTVSVSIGERHFGQPVMDPAAQTELGKLLQECGFLLVDDKGTNKADVEITGDAFSAYGARKGSLVSCRARVEIKVHRKNGNAVLVDRETTVAVDIAEQTAAKTALEKAAAELAERVLPKLAQ